MGMVPVALPPPNFPVAGCARACHFCAAPHVALVLKLPVTLDLRPMGCWMLPLMLIGEGTMPVQFSVPLRLALPPLSTVPLIEPSVACGATAWYIHRSRFGFEMQQIGDAMIQ